MKSSTFTLLLAAMGVATIIAIFAIEAGKVKRRGSL